MRIRFKKSDLLDLARLYRGAAANERRRAEDMRNSTQVHLFIDQAKRNDARAQKLDRLAGLAEDFILMPAEPFNGGPPSLLVVGGSDARDGSAFADGKAKRKRA